MGSRAAQRRQQLVGRPLARRHFFLIHALASTAQRAPRVNASHSQDALGRDVGSTAGRLEDQNHKRSAARWTAHQDEDEDEDKHEDEDENAEVEGRRRASAQERRTMAAATSSDGAREEEPDGWRRAADRPLQKRAEQREDPGRRRSHASLCLRLPPDDPRRRDHRQPGQDAGPLAGGRRDQRSDPAHGCAQELASDMLQLAGTRMALDDVQGIDQHTRRQADAHKGLKDDAIDP
eukprot:TRINITY_DN11997_c0_g1_i1.p3 TRINITY_DN11997_c0_g1~~TRINITY_DN11997_c0_g1_i1.p3  ORF type:complete len:235 (+),score=33.19 TRINITY_DN11997_c0_g1_i1:93-797(+)